MSVVVGGAVSVSVPVVVEVVAGVSVAAVVAVGVAKAIKTPTVILYSQLALTHTSTSNACVCIVVDTLCLTRLLFRSSVVLCRISRHCVVFRCTTRCGHSFIDRIFKIASCCGTI